MFANSYLTEITLEYKVSIEGVSHITLIVKDLERSADLFMSIFGAEQVYSSDNQQFSISKEKFLLIGGTWIALMEGPPLPERNYNHIAFKIPASEFDDYKNRLAAAGVECREDRSRVPGEGASLYFYDFDNHFFELHTGTLQERLKTYKQQKTADNNL